MSPVRPTVQVVGRRLEAQDHRLRDFLTRIAQPHEWLEAGSADADRLLERVGLVGAPLPVVVDGDRTFADATVEMLARGRRQPATPTHSHYGFAIIRARPARPAAAGHAPPP